MIVFLLFRVGDRGSIVSWGAGFLDSERAENDLVMGVFTSTGYLFIVLVLMIGISFNDTGKVTVSYEKAFLLSSHATNFI